MKHVQADLAAAHTQQSRAQNTVVLSLGVIMIALALSIMLLETVLAKQPDYNYSQRWSFTPNAPKTLRVEELTIYYTGEDFRNLWRNAELPNAEPRDTNYEITGDNQADTYIREKGEERGYERQIVAKSGLVYSGGYAMQPGVKTAWEELVADAASDGVRISLRLSSGHRDAREQALIFNQFLRQNAGFTPSTKQLISGQVDQALQSTLDRVAPPGYSKHHTGYTLDICDAALNACATRFANTPGERWLSADNYANARSHGFIPSYPPDVENQGPNPEPWEYVWVGPDNLTIDTYLKIIDEA